MATTYQLIQAARDIVHGAWDSDEDLDRAIAEYVEEASIKLDALRYVHQRMAAEAEYLAKEIEKLGARKRQLERTCERVKGWATQLLAEHTRLTGEHVVRTAEGSYNLRRYQHVRGPESVEDWPERFVRSTKRPDKQAAREALLAGEHIDGIELIETESIQWR